MKHALKDYKIRLDWSEEDEAWIASVSEIAFCTGDGETPEEAIRALQETFDVLQEAYAEDRKAFPGPARPLLPTTESLKRVADYYNLSRLAKEAGISPQTLSSKIRRGTELKEDEARHLRNVLVHNFASAITPEEASQTFVEEDAALYGLLKVLQEENREV